MGRPQIDSVDKYITYPIVYSFVPYFKDIHPIYITIACIVSKYFSILLLYSQYPFLLSFVLLTERGLDCLDGEVARYYNKCTLIGHYLDKYSDVVFRLIMTKICLEISLTASYFNISCLLLFLGCLMCPGVYVFDYLKGNIKSDMNTNPMCVSLVLEDNATLLCFIIPILISFIPNP